MPNKTKAQKKQAKASTQQQNGQTAVSARQPKKRNRTKANYTTTNKGMMAGPMVQANGVSNMPFAGKRRPPVRMNGLKLSESGMNFLKCAFAPPDFASINVGGVPDNFRGMSLVKKHKMIRDVIFPVNFDQYFLIVPIPGFAYFTAQVATGIPIQATTVFTGVPYSDATALFGTTAGGAANIVSEFRFVSLHAELIPTTNQASWTGSVQCFKMPLAMMLKGNSLSVTVLPYTVTGLQGCNSTNASMYSGPFNLGVFAAAYNTGAEFEFSPIMEDILGLPANFNPASDFGTLNVGGDLKCIPGFDNQFESLLIKVGGVTGGNNTAMLKTWACVEYQVSPIASIYEYQTMSPCDPVAINLYREIIAGLPVGVSFVDNDTFWQRVLSIIKTVAGVGTILPGSYGAVAGGVYSLSELMEKLVM